MFKVIITTAFIVFQSFLLLAQSPGLIYFPLVEWGSTMLNLMGMVGAQYLHLDTCLTT